MPPECEDGWEYDNHPLIDTVAQASSSLLQRMRAAAVAESKLLVADTRVAHNAIYCRVTPPGHACFAGNFRGHEPCACLYCYQVAVGYSNGAWSHDVHELMAAFSRDLVDALARLDGLADTMDRAQRITRIVSLACDAMVTFLAIHPYANGNGHISRLLTVGILGRYGLWLDRWPVHGRPDDPPYSAFISQYRAGYTKGLRLFLLSHVVEDPQP